MTDQKDIDTHRIYSIRMILRVAGRSPSGYYGACRQKVNTNTQPAKKRGPVTEITDEEILVLIEKYIQNDIFHGTGYKKIHAKINQILRGKGYSIGKNRVFHIMQSKDIPGKAPGGSGSSRIHDGTITKENPNEMWGTDGKKFWTKQDGWCWLFDTADHFNSEIIGWNVVKIGDRFEATRSVQNAVQNRFGSLEKGVAAGLQIRSDLGSQYTSDYFMDSMDHLGIDISFSWAHSPECNGIIERFHRTIQEQLFDLFEFENLDEAIAGIGEFIEKYNNFWILERHGYLSPLEKLNDYKKQKDKKVA